MDHFEYFGQFWQHLTILRVFDIFRQFWQYLIFFTNLTIVDNFDNALTILDHCNNFWQFCLTILDYFDIDWQFWPLLTIWTMLVNFDHFLDFFGSFDNFEQNDKDNPADFWHQRQWLQFWQLKTWIHDNLCHLRIKSDTDQYSHFLRCFYRLSQ